MPDPIPVGSGNSYKTNKRCKLIAASRLTNYKPAQYLLVLDRQPLDDRLCCTLYEHSPCCPTHPVNFPPKEKYCIIRDPILTSTKDLPVKYY